MTENTLLMIDSGAIADAISIAVAGLLIVFTALLLISLFIASLPHFLAMVARIWPEVDDSHSHQSQAEGLVRDDGAVLAAIGFVLHSEVQRQLAAEDTSARKN